MERLYVYNGALAVVGFSLAFQAVLSLLAGEQSIPLLLMAIGGAGTVLGASYESLRTDPEEFTVSTTALVALVGAACVSLLGTVLAAAV